MVAFSLGLNTKILHINSELAEVHFPFLNESRGKMPHSGDASLERPVIMVVAPQ